MPLGPMQTLGCGQCEACIVFWWVQHHCLSHICGSYGVVKPQRVLIPWPLCAQSEAQKWLFGEVWAAILRHSLLCLPRTTKPFWRINGSNIVPVPWRGCHVSPITQQDLWQNGLMNLKVKLNTVKACTPHLNFLKPLWGFGGASQKNLLLHQHHIVT